MRKLQLRKVKKWVQDPVTCVRVEARRQKLWPHASDLHRADLLGLRKSFAGVLTGLSWEDLPIKR